MQIGEDVIGRDFSNILVINMALEKITLMPMRYIQLYDKLLDATDQGKVTLDLVIDLSKAFDTVNHDILLGIILANLKFYRVRVFILLCFKSCLYC